MSDVAEMMDVMFNGRAARNKEAEASAFRRGYEAGFAKAQAHIAMMLDEEGKGKLALRVRKMSLQKK